MSFVFTAPLPVINVGIRMLQIYIGICWIMVIYRTIFTLNQLDILSIPIKFPHQYANFSVSSNAKESSSSTPFNTKNLNFLFNLIFEFLFFISLIESLFSIYCLYLIHSINKNKNQIKNNDYSFKFMKDLILDVLGSGLDIPKPHQHDISNHENKCLTNTDSTGRYPNRNFLKTPLSYNDPKAEDFRENHVVWFQNCKWTEIYKENQIEWLCSVLLNKTIEEVKEEDKSKTKQDELIYPQLEELTIAYEKRTGTQLRPGYNEALRSKIIRLSIDPIKVSLRPLTLSYGLAWMTHESIYQIMKLNGFKNKQCVNRKNALKYLIRIPDEWYNIPDHQKPPAVIFIHGVGLGFILYIALLKYLTYSNWSKKRPIIILIQPHISMRIFSKNYLSPPNEKEAMEDMEEIVSEYKNGGVELISHSNGTVIAGWIIKKFGNLVKRSCLIDPICFTVWEGHVCYNFLYSEPKTGLEKLVRYGMGEELGIALYTRRYFNWPDAVLWPHQIPGFTNPKRFLVVLAGNDAIINAPRIRRYLSEEGMSEANSEVSQFHHSEESLLVCQEGGIQVDIDQQGSSQSNRGNRQSNQLHGGQIQGGGILFDPDAAHGQVLTFGHPFLRKIFDWIEGDDYI